MNEFGVKNFSFEDKIKELFSEIKKPIENLYELFYKHIYGFFNEKTYNGENVFEIMINETGRELERRIVNNIIIVNYIRKIPRRKVADMSSYYKFGYEVISEISDRENRRLND